MEVGEEELMTMLLGGSDAQHLVTFRLNDQGHVRASNEITDCLLELVSGAGERQCADRRTLAPQVNPAATLKRYMRSEVAAEVR